MFNKLIPVILCFTILFSSSHIVYGKQIHSEEELENAMKIMRASHEDIHVGDFNLTGYSIDYEGGYMNIYGVNWSEEAENYIKELTGISNFEFGLDYDFLDYDIPNRPEILVYFDNNRLHVDPDPVMINSRVFVPIRDIFEAMGYSVIWDETNRKVTATKENINIFLMIDDKNMFKIDADGMQSQVEMDVAIQMIEGRAYIPLRYFAELSEYEVNWYDEKKCVIIK